jgi:hypothetical protein
VRTRGVVVAKRSAQYRRLRPHVTDPRPEVWYDGSSISVRFSMDLPGMESAFLWLNVDSSKQPEVRAEVVTIRRDGDTWVTAKHPLTPEHRNIGLLPRPYCVIRHVRQVEELS